MKEDNFLENLVYKMVKAIDKKNQESFFNLKSTFVSVVSNKEDKETLPLQNVKLADIQDTGF